MGQKTMTEHSKNLFWGCLCAAIGSIICLIATGVIDYPADQIHAPGWIVFLAGAIFTLGGLAIIFRSKPILVSIIGNLMVAVFAIIGVWVAIWSSSEGFSGGIPFLPRELNVTLGRWVFGVGAVISSLILIPGIKQLLKSIRSRRQT